MYLQNWVRTQIIFIISADALRKNFFFMCKSKIISFVIFNVKYSFIIVFKPIKKNGHSKDFFHRKNGCLIRKWKTENDLKHRFEWLGEISFLPKFSTRSSTVPNGFRKKAARSGNRKSKKTMGEKPGLKLLKMSFWRARWNIPRALRQCTIQGAGACTIWGSEIVYLCIWLNHWAL